MENNPTRIAPEAPADESASPLNQQPEWDSAEAAPVFEAPPLLSDTLADTLADRIPDAVEQCFPPGSRKPRHDGFTPEKVGDFLRHLSATGVGEHAAAAVGLSASAAYAFRNRTRGRAFAKMWDAVLVHRTRARLASELNGRAIAGCVSVRKRDGEVVGEYHYYDNRLAMALLTRLDRLAEKEAPSEAHLRVLSEDLEDFIDCLAEGGDADAFVEERRPVPSQVEGLKARKPEPAEPDDDPELTAFARMAGCPDYRGVSPLDIEVRDLDLSRKSDWSDEQWVRAFRSGFLSWAEPGETDPDPPSGLGTAYEYFFFRKAVMAANLVPKAEIAHAGTSAPDPARLWEWSEAQLGWGHRSGLLGSLPGEFWDDIAAGETAIGEEE